MYVVSSVDGSLYAALGGMDGLLIEQYPKEEHDLSALAAEYTNVFTAVSRLGATGFELGDTRDVMITSERLMSYARILSDDLFLIVVMNPSGNLGKARMYSDQVAPKILEFF